MYSLYMFTNVHDALKWMGNLLQIPLSDCLPTKQKLKTNSEQQIVEKP